MILCVTPGQMNQAVCAFYQSGEQLVQRTVEVKRMLASLLVKVRSDR